MVGVILGAALSSSSTPSPVAGSGLPAGGVLPGGPPAAPKTVCGHSGHAGGGPYLCMATQSLGPVTTAWVVQASGFAPGTPVTVMLSFNSPPRVVPAQTFDRTARLRPVTGPDGTLRLNVNQLFPASLQLGRFYVQVTGAGGREATTEFIVIPG